ncbi:hypothetical protein ColLi_05610 [Colletotrichum liriopes]|uniref:Uncharacterized protein n=1 Tax=Colletotrichum liriopes TaxID=708192 RepID=A0AA37GLR7_9PEZI|nr:hypothetical protein ColLi_05610 [Colletotrichum liriopes]
MPFDESLRASLRAIGLLLKAGQLGPNDDDDAVRSKTGRWCGAESIFGPFMSSVRDRRRAMAATYLTVVESTWVPEVAPKERYLLRSEPSKVSQLIPTGQPRP